MANIFKTTLKKDVIADIANNNTKEIRFPITKFWATRLTDSYNLDDRSFEFKTFDSLEVSSPSNKDTEGETYVLDFVRTYVDSDDFVVEFTMGGDEHTIVSFEDAIVISENIQDIPENNEDTSVDSDDNYEYISNDDIFILIKQWFDDENVLDSLYNDDNVFATNARQIIILPKGKILGFNKSLPVDNDVEIRVEFDKSEKIYFDSFPDFDVFEEEVYRTFSVIRKNNFVFIWKMYTGIFKDNDGRVYFGIKYSTRKSVGFNRRYNVQ